MNILVTTRSRAKDNVANLNKSTEESWCTFCSFGAKDICVQFTKVELKSSSLRRRSCQAQSWTTPQMLKGRSIKMIAMASKACPSFFQVHQILLFTSSVADQTNLINHHKLISTLLAEDMSTRAKSHKWRRVGQSSLAARAYIGLVKRLGFLLVASVFREVYREESLQLEFLVALWTDCIGRGGLYFNRSFWCSRRQPKCLHCPQCLLFIRSDLHAIRPMEAILVLAVVFITVLWYCTMVLLIKCIKFSGFLQR